MMRFTLDVKIPMRDGIHLNALIYRPETDSPVPAILAITPYGADSGHSKGIEYRGRGFAYISADVRGKGNSEGDYKHYGPSEGEDGSDLVEWIAAQDWCNADVVMRGTSYLGTNQWLTGSKAPPHLKAIVPGASAFLGVGLPSYGGINFNEVLQWHTLVDGVANNDGIYDDQKFWMLQYYQHYKNHLPYNQLDEIVLGQKCQPFQEELSHPEVSDYYNHGGLTVDQIKKINIPVMTLTGIYDDSQLGALEYYFLHMENASPSAASKHFLVIGPWDHGGASTPAKSHSGFTFGDEALLDLDQLHDDWFCWVLGRGERPAFLQKQIAYYMTGAEQWRYADNLEAIATEDQKLFLNSNNGKADSVFCSGSLDTKLTATSQPDSYKYDPLDIRPGELELDEPYEDVITDQRQHLNLYGRGLVYHTEPFEESQELAGFIKFSAWIELNVKDTDFFVTLSEITEDGQHILLTQQLLRARYRNSLRVAELIVPGEINHYQFDRFRFFARKIAKNSRLRLVIRAPNSIQFEKNYNAGGVVAEESGKDAQTAEVILHHDKKFPSCLELPVVKNYDSH